MMSYLNKIFLFILFLISIDGYAQNLNEMIKAVEMNLTFPIVKSHRYMGVLPVSNSILHYETNQKHQIAIDLELGFSDSSQVNFGVTEIGRTLNLHVANGARKEHIDMAVIIHGPALSSFYNDVMYKRKYGMENPNAPIIRELSQNGVKFYVCGQNLSLFQLSSDNLLAETEVVLSAKTTITLLQSQGYSFLYIWPGY